MKVGDIVTAISGWSFCPIIGIITERRKSGARVIFNITCIGGNIINTFNPVGIKELAFYDLSLRPTILIDLLSTDNFTCDKRIKEFLEELANV